MLHLDPDLSFGEWLRRQRGGFGLTQAELARELGCAPITLRKVEAEERRPSIELAQRMAEILQVPADQHVAFMRFARGELRAGAALPVQVRAAPLDAKLATPESQAANGATPFEPARLPSVPYQIIGREDLLARARAMLAPTQKSTQVRILSLVGPPGVGKTRTALELAQDEAITQHFKDGVVFIELAPVLDPKLIPAVIAEALHIEDANAANTAAAVRAVLRQRNVLLVLDNFEHVLDAAAFVAELVAACAGVACLITSRERLRVRMEHVLNVPTLELPKAPTLEQVQRSAAAQLFIACAQQANSNFTLTAADAPALAALCARLEGLPLALELLAARADVFTPTQLHDDLMRGLDALEDGPRDLPERQRTLRNAIRSSVRLLSESQQACFAHLAVFAGSFDADAAQAVCDCTDAALQALGRSSLVQPFGEGRWRLLEPIRQYAEELLTQQQAWNAAKCRHALHMAHMAETARGELLGAHAAAWTIRLESENANLQAAILWALGAKRPDIALRIGHGVFRFWHRRGMWREALAWLEQGLAMDAATGPAASEVTHATADTRAKAARAAGTMSHTLGQYERADQHFQHSLGLAYQIEDDIQVAACYQMLGTVRKDQGRFEEALSYFDQSIKLQSPETLKFPWQSKADTLLRLGRFDEAETLYQQAAALNKRIHDEEGLAHTYRGLGEIAWRRGDAAAAEAFFRQNEAICLRLNHAHALSWTHQHRGNIARVRGQWREAALQYAEALTQMSRLGNRHGICEVLLEGAHLAVQMGQYALAAQWLGMGQAGLDALGAKLTPYENGLIALSSNACAQQLDAQTMRHATQAGVHRWQAWEIDGVIAALQHSVDDVGTTD